jgi:hypothetical protein
LERAFGEGVGVEGDFQGCRGGGGDDAGVESGFPDVIEGESRPVGCTGGVGDGGKVAGGDAWFEDQVCVRFGDTAAVVDDRQSAVAAGLQGRGDVDAGSAGVAGVAEELGEGVLGSAGARGCVGRPRGL